MASIARVPITNVYADGDYTGLILVGAKQQPMNVLLDTGSSALALNDKKYTPNIAGGDKTTDLAQTDSYGDGSSWTGAVITTSLTMGTGASAINLAGGNAAIAYTASKEMWGDTDGILGLAYAPLDDAFTMPGDTWTNKYTAVQVRTGKQGTIEPYLTQLADAGVVSDIISFITRRSFVHVGGGGANDPLNQGIMVVGGGVEETDLYTGTFQNVKVLADEWYNTNLKSVTVGTTDPIAARLKGPKGFPSNSIVDSGTNSLNLPPQMLNAVISKFNTAQQALLTQSILDGKLVSAASLNLATWPTLAFILQGDTADVTLKVAPSDYWQINAQKVGYAMAAITKGDPGLSILGLPIMNGYYTVFDGEADSGRGVIRFATKAV
jgi:hypothetical protein